MVLVAVTSVVLVECVFLAVPSGPLEGPGETAPFTKIGSPARGKRQFFSNLVFKVDIRSKTTTLTESLVGFLGKK
jgi:hypothetical protein